MRHDLQVSQIRFVRAPEDLLATGLLGWVNLQFAGLELDGLAVRRGPDGVVQLGFPSRVDAEGRRHPYVRPLRPAVRASIERQVVEYLRNRGYVA